MFHHFFSSLARSKYLSNLSLSFIFTFFNFFFDFHYYYYCHPLGIIHHFELVFLLLKSKWEQISTGLLDSSKYSCWSQQCWSLDGFDSSSNLQLTQSLFQAFWNTKCNWYHHPLHVPQPFQFSSKIQDPLSFIFTLWFTGTAKSSNKQIAIFLLINTWSGLLAKI